MRVYFLICLVVVGHQVAARPSEDTVVTTPNTTPSVSSSAPISNDTPVVNQTVCTANKYSCSVCLKVEGCKYVEYPEVSANCLPMNESINEDGAKATVVKEIKNCENSQDDTTTADPVETTTNSSTDVTTTVSTTTPAISTTAVPVPPPEGKGGRFDGWSFFGGILLTLGLAAIGLVGFKYYKLRSGSGGNYNRF